MPLPPPDALADGWLYASVMVMGLTGLVGSALDLPQMWRTPAARWYDKALGGHQRARAVFGVLGAALLALGVMGFLGVFP